MGAGPHRHARVNTHTRSGQGQPPLHSLPVAMWGGEGWAGDPPRPSPRLPPRMPTAEPLPSPRPAPPPSAPPPSARTPGSVHGGAGELLSPRVGAGAASAQLCRPPAVSLPTLRMREQFSATPAFTMPPTPGHRTPGQALPPPPERLRPQRAFTWGPRIALGLGLPFLQLHGQPKVGNADVAWRTNTAQVTYSPTNRGPGLPGAAGALASFCTHTCTPGTRTCTSMAQAHTRDPTPRCGQTGVSSSTCSWSPGPRPPASLFRELCSLSLWGRQVSVQPLMGRGP